jgi:hypothetical protein
VPRPATGRSLQPPFKSSRQKREATFQAPWVPRDRELYFIIRAGDRVKAAASMASYLDDSERLLTAVESSLISVRSSPSPMTVWPPMASTNMAAAYTI